MKDKEKHRIYQRDWVRALKKNDPEKYAARQAKATETRRKRDPEQLRLKQFRNNLSRYYGLSLEDYTALQQIQNYKCAICKEEFIPTPKYPRLPVDHAHITNKVRGLLCVKCNLGLGAFRDSIPYLENAIKYLAKAMEFEMERK